MFDLFVWITTLLFWAWIVLLIMRLIAKKKDPEKYQWRRKWSNIAIIACGVFFVLSIPVGAMSGQLEDSSKSSSSSSTKTSSSSNTSSSKPKTKTYSEKLIEWMEMANDVKVENENTTNPKITIIGPDTWYKAGGANTQVKQVELIETRFNHFSGNDGKQPIVTVKTVNGTILARKTNDSTDWQLRDITNGNWYDANEAYDKVN